MFKSQTASGFHRSISNDNASHGYGSHGYGSPQQTNTGYPFSTQNSTGSGYQNGNYDSMTSSYDATEPDFYSTGIGGGGLDDYGGTTSPEAAVYGAPTSPPVRAQPVVPDAVLNMAAKGPKDKQPFAYVADVNDIREQRDRVRKRLMIDDFLQTHQINCTHWFTYFYEAHCRYKIRGG